MDEIWWLWLRAFVGSGRRDGVLDGFDEAETTTVLGSLPREVRASAAFLCWVTIRRRTDQREYVVAVQDILVPVLDHGLLEPTLRTAKQAGQLGAESPTVASMTEDLLGAATFVDDDLWCAKSAEELGLDGIWLEERRGNVVPLAVHVAGISDPLTDPRLPRLLASAVRYRRTSAAAVLETDLRAGARGTSNGWRLVWSAVQQLYFLRNLTDDELESTSVMDGSALQSLAASGRSLEAAFPATSMNPDRTRTEPTPSG